MKNKRMLSLKMAIITMLTVVPLNVASATSEEVIDISLIPSPEVDVALSVGNSQAEVESFEEDLLNEIERRGVNTENFNIQSVEAVEENVFLGTFSMQIYWPRTGDDMDAHIYFYEGNTQRGHLYYANRSQFGATLDTDDRVGGTGEWLTIDFDALPSNIDKMTFKVHGWSGSANTDMRFFREFNGEREMIINTTHRVGHREYFYFGDLIREGDGWDFHYRDGSIFSGSQVTINSKDFTEVIREPDWREQSQRFIVNLDDNEIADFNNPVAMGEIVPRLTNEEIHYIGAGTNTNRNQALEFISNNNGNGTFVDNRNYNNFISETAEYIISQLDTVSDENYYVLVGEDIDINVNPSHLLTNTANAEYPNGRWRIEHDYEYFDNNRGQASWTEQWQEDLVMSFDRPGRYEIFFEDINPNPRYIYAHRRPLAMFNLSLSNGNITYQDNSYDPDRESNANRGITQREWRYLDINTNTWHSGRPTTYNANSNMMIQLRVLDEQGAWSRPFTRYITGSNNSGNTQPIADFTITDRIINRYQEVSVINNSYDPSGRAINSTRWRIYKGDELVYNNSTFSPNFRNFDIGDYVIQLEVRNSNGTWSEPFRRHLTLVEDTNPPEATVSNNFVSWTNEDIEVNVSYNDYGSGFNSHRYYISTSSTPPANNSGLWSSWISNDEHTFNITNSGERYIHIQARDNEGNILRRTLGAYQIDKVNPNASISINGGDTFSPTREVELTINASDVHSGLRRITVSEGSKTRNIPLSSVSDGSVSIPWTFEEGMFGDIVLTVEDNAGNIRVVNDSIIIDELNLEDFVLEDIINPTRFHEDNPFIPKANEDIEPSPMLSGANFEIGLNVREPIDSSFVRDTVSYEVIKVLPDGSRLTETGIMDGNSFGEYIKTIQLPDDLDEGTRVYVKAKVERDLLIEPYSTQVRHFPENPNDKVFIGEVERDITEVIRFREIN